MWMSEFVTTILSEIRSFENNSPSNHDQHRIHPLVSREGEEQYHKLINYLLQYINCHDDVKFHAKKIEKLFIVRFREKSLTRVFFHITPYSKINFAYATLARKLAELTNKPIYNLLMPSVSFTREIYGLAPHEFFLIKRGDKFFAISIVDYLDHLTRPSFYKKFNLTKKEISFIVNHSDETRRYANAIVMNNEPAIKACREKLVNALKQANYYVSAPFDKESDAFLAKNLLPTKTDQQELASIMAGYIANSEWVTCLDLINNKNLFHAMLGVEFDHLDLKSQEAETHVVVLAKELNEKCCLLESLFLCLSRKEENIKEKTKKIPNLMRVISSFNMADMLQKTKFNMVDFKKLMEQNLKKKLRLLPKESLQSELNQYANWDILIADLVSLSVSQKQINTFNLLNQSDLFRLMLNFDIKKYKSLQAHNVRGLSDDELLLIQVNDDLIQYSIKKDSIPCDHDSFIRVYFLLLFDLYKRQRDFKGDKLISPLANKAMLGLHNKNNKMAACELFQNFLSSDYPLHEFYSYPLNDPLLTQYDLSALYQSLSSKTLGSIFDVALKFFVVFNQYKNTENSLSSQGLQNEQHIVHSFVGEVENWQEKVKYLANRMSEKAWKNFIGSIYDLGSQDEARQYLATTILHYSHDLNRLVDALAVNFPKDKWMAVTQSIGLVNWLCMVTGIDIRVLKTQAKGNPIEFENELWKNFDNQFSSLECTFQGHSFVHIQAYCFCMAMTYKRQREKRGNYTSNIASTASLFGIAKVASKCDKISACEALITFILDDNVEWSESGLKDYLQKKYKKEAIKYFHVLLSNSLGILTRKILGCVPQAEKMAYKKI